MDDMTAKDAIDKATSLGYEDLVYDEETDCLSAVLWLGGKRARVAIYARGTWFMD